MNTSYQILLRYFCLICFFSVELCFGQNICEKLPEGSISGSFEIEGNITVGCSPYLVKVKDLSGGSDLRYNFYYQNELATQLDRTNNKDTENVFFSSSTGIKKYTILQYGSLNGKPSYACKTISVRPNNQPVFSSSACNDLLEIIIDSDIANDFDLYQINWGDGTFTNIPEGQSLPIRNKHFYSSSSNSRQILVEGFYKNPNNCAKPTSKTISMNGGENYPNISSIELLENRKQVKLTFDGAYDTYDLYQRGRSGSYTNGSVFTQLKPGAYTLNITDTLQSCFKLFRNFGCREGSGEVCTTNTKLEAIGETNSINWQNHPTGNVSITYDVQVKTESVKTIINKFGTQQAQISNPGNPHVDFVDCKQKYCYQVEQLVSGSIDYNRFSYTSKSISPKKCIDRSETKPSPITESIVSSRNNNLVDIEVVDNGMWPIPVEKYYLHRVENDKTLQSDSSINTNFVDVVNSENSQVCYKIGYKDKCNSYSILSDKFCTVNLKQTDKLLSWSGNSPFGTEKVDKYVLIILNDSAFTEKEVAELNSNEQMYAPTLDTSEESVKYRLKIISSSGNVSYSNTVEIPIQAFFFLPSGVTPNSDGINDVFQLFGPINRIKSYSLKIFNRWGEQIKKISASSPEQNYNFDISPLNSGTFNYLLNITLKDGQEIQKYGNLEILK